MYKRQGVCSTCVSTAAVGTIVGSVDTCAASLQRPGNAIDYGELCITTYFTIPLPSARSSAYVTESASLPIAVYLALDLFSYLPIYY